MSMLPYQVWALFALVACGHAAATCGEDESDDAVLFQMRELRAKPPVRNGLTDWERNMISDDQDTIDDPVYTGMKKTVQAPFYNGQTNIHRAHPASAPSNEQMRIVILLILALFAMLGVIALLLCLVSSRGVAVSKMTWGMLSHAISVFCAFLVFNAAKELTTYILATYTARVFTATTSFVLLAGFIAVMHLLLLVLRSWPLTMMSIGILGLYTCSFAAVDAFDFLTRVVKFAELDLSWSICVFLLCLVSVIAFVVLSNTARLLLDSLLKFERLRYLCCCCFVFGADTVKTPAWNEWKKHSARSEDHFAAVTIGYLSSQAVEYAIIRSLPVHSMSFNFHVLLVAALTFMMLSLVIAAASRVGATQTGQPGRARSLILNTCMMGAAWCLFHATQWQYNGGFAGQSLGLSDNSFRASLLVALTLSLIALCTQALVCFYSLSYQTLPWEETSLANFQALVSALGFAIGVAWVTCFFLGLPHIVPIFKAFLPEPAASLTVPSAVVAIVVVLPLWGMHVLPRTFIGKVMES